MYVSAGRPTNARARKNEETFAYANEQIRARAEEVQFDDAVPFLCECSDVECVATIALPLTTYRDARAQGEVFILLAGHDDPRVERVVGNAAEHILVEKLP